MNAWKTPLNMICLLYTSDVRRQRHFAELIQLFVQSLGIVLEGYIFVAIRQGLVYCGRQGAITKAQLGASLHPAAGAG